MEIRRLNTEDADIIKAASNDFKDSMISQEQAIKFLKCDDNYFIACIDGDKAVGFLMAYSLQRFDGTEMMYIHEVDVKEEYRRTGIGKAMIEHIKAICIEEGFVKMFVITNKSNSAAMGLYGSTGGIAKHDDDIIFEYRF